MHLEFVFIREVRHPDANGVMQEEIFLLLDP